MSIYGSTWSVDADDHTDTCQLWQLAPPGLPILGPLRYDNDGTVHYIDRNRSCTCLCGPVVYQGSHVLPADTDRRAGTFGFAEIPGHITRDGRDDGPEDDDRPWPWLRVTMRAEGAPDCQDVVLDRGQAETLRDYLIDWLQRTEAEHPATCSCTHFSDTGGFRIGDLCCPVHGVDGAKPLDGPWDIEVTA